jgi:hypothetical protein
MGKGTPAMKPSDLTVPVLIACTGHRDPHSEDVPALRAAVKGFLEHSLELYPLRLLCGLAEGADLLVAEEALELEAKGGKHRVWITALLPFPKEIYAKTFSTPEEARRMLEMLQRPEVDSFLVPALDNRDLPEPDDLPGWQALSEDKEERERRYRELGACMAIYGQIMIAIWDGETGKAGGTEEVVRYCVRGVPPDLYPPALSDLSWTDHGPVFHFWTRRSKGAPIGGRVGEVRELYPLDPTDTSESLVPHPIAVRDLFAQQWADAWEKVKWSRWSILLALFDSWVAIRDGLLGLWAQWFHETPASLRALRRVSHHNRDNLAKLNLDLVKVNAEEKKEAAREALEKTGVDYASLPARLQRMFVMRRAVSDLANVRSRRHWWYVLVTFCVIGLAAMSLDHYLAHHHAQVYGPFALQLFVALIFLAWILAIGSHLLHRESRLLDERSYSEALRVQCYWSLTGVPRSVPASYMHRIRSEFRWLRGAVRALALPYDESILQFQALTQSQKLARHKAALKGWVLEQEDYFQKAQRKYRVQLVFTSSLGHALALLAWGFALWIGYQGATHPPKPLVYVVAPVLIFGGLLIAYAENRRLSEWAYTYERMRDVFRHARARVERLMMLADSASGQEIDRIISDIQTVFDKLGGEALEENADWLVLHRARPFEPPVH